MKNAPRDAPNRMFGNQDMGCPKCGKKGRASFTLKLCGDQSGYYCRCGYKVRGLEGSNNGRVGR